MAIHMGYHQTGAVYTHRSEKESWRDVALLLLLIIAAGMQTDYVAKLTITVWQILYLDIYLNSRYLDIS